MPCPGFLTVDILSLKTQTLQNRETCSSPTLMLSDHNPMARLIIIPFLITHLFQVVSSYCSRDSTLLLLQFKQNLNIDESASSGCGELYGNPSYPKTASWNASTDCCTWDGVTCDDNEFNREEVIGLDLSCSQLQGAINSNTTLFRFPHLQTLNLAFNDFSSSLISTNFSRLRRLTYLNLSSSGFSGLLPVQFLSLYNLVSLDLSLTDGIVIQPHIFKSLLQNSTRWREVILSDCDIVSVLPRNLSNSFTVLNLGSTNLFGVLPLEILRLPKLNRLQFFSNPSLSGELSEAGWNSSSVLMHLDLSGTNISGELPESIGSLNSYNYLTLSESNFSGAIPESLGNLTQMAYLYLSFNNFIGQVPSNLANLHHLIYLDLSSNRLQGRLPDSFSNFRNLTQLYLNDNLFNGSFPSPILNATQLNTLDITNNSFSGPLPPTINGFPDLVYLSLDENSFNGTLPSWILSLPSLIYLQLRSNQLTGELHEFEYHSLQRIFVSGNNFSGAIPKSIQKLVNLTHLDLSSNLFTGFVDVSFFSDLKLLKLLSLSNNSLVLTRNGSNPNATLPESLNFLYLSSCGLKDLDYLTQKTTLLGRLDVSHNMLQGELFSDQKWYFWANSLLYLDVSHNFLTRIKQLPYKNLFFLDLRYNLLQGPMPIPPSINTRFFFASNNNFSGEVPSSICNLSALLVLDFSENNLSGVIPPCLVNTSNILSVLDMHRNHFSGTIPETFAVGSNLRTLNLRDNRLEGTIPRPLSKCTELEVLDIGHNYLNGSFPSWLAALPKLKVLSLRANKLHGLVSSPEDPNSFASLSILDLSNNAFSGVLPVTTFKTLRAMKRNDNTSHQLAYIGEEFYQDSIVVIIKGLEINYVRILSIFTAMDLSVNSFEEQIPDEIGDLTALRGLNLSHNNLAGPIPESLGNMEVLESLDLSSNQLQGHIPQQLTDLPYLSFFNVCYNHLVGTIPEGQQFGTFTNNSYLGNSGLCGYPLSKNCRDNTLNPAPALVEEDHNEEFFSGFTWQAVLIGYGCGMVIGGFTGCLIFITGKPEWFNKTVQREYSRWVKKKWPKYVKWL